MTLNVESAGRCGFWAVSHFLGYGQGDFLAIQEELHQHILDNRAFYEDNRYFTDVGNMLKRIHFPDPKKNCFESNCMSMPSMGDPLANAFERPVFFFCQTYSQTVFPTSCPPNNNPPIFIAFFSSHFFVSEMKYPLLFPAPQLLKNWEGFAAPEALAWREKYARFFDWTCTLKASAPPNKYRHY